MCDRVTDTSQQGAAPVLGSIRTLSLMSILSLVVPSQQLRWFHSKLWEELHPLHLDPKAQQDPGRVLGLHIPLIQSRRLHGF